jgi:hypothetical protein
MSDGDDEDEQEQERNQQLDERPVEVAAGATPIGLIADADGPLTTARGSAPVWMEALHHRSSEWERSQWTGHQLLAERGSGSIQ